MRRVHPIIAAVFAGLFMIATSGISISQTVPHAPGKLYMSIPPQEKTVIARTAVVVQRRIAQARADIHNKAFKKAVYEAYEAARLMRTMRDNLSSSMARDLISIAMKHLEYEPAKKALQDLPPIYASLDEIQDYLPTDKARRHIDRAGSLLEKDDKRGAEKELALADRSLVSVAVELPVLAAEKYVARAGRYLVERKPGKADAALEAAEREVKAVSPGGENPFHLAYNNLWQATKSYSAGKMAEAKTYISQAKVYLERATMSGNAKGKEEAGKLSGEIAELEAKIDRGGKESGLALKSVWERSEALAERAAEYLAAGYEMGETTLADENELIEAKLHVAYAETYQVTAGEPDKAVEETNKALSYLKKAVRNRLSDKAAVRIISNDEKELNDLKANPDKSGTDIEERYDAVKSDLSKLIQEI